MKKIAVRLYAVCIMCLYTNAGWGSQLNFITLNVPPWATVDTANQQVKGMFADIIQELQARTGLKINMAVAPYARINRELAAGRQDCTILITDDERAEITTLGQIVFKHPMGVLPHHSIDVQSYDDLQGLTISVLSVLDVFQQFSKYVYIKKEYDVDYETGIRKVKHKRVDAIAGAIPTIQYLAKKQGSANLFSKPLLLDLVPVYLQCANSVNDMHMSMLNKAIHNMHADGAMKKIESKFVNL